jgi:hypothetical protein
VGSICVWGVRLEKDRGGNRPDDGAKGTDVLVKVLDGYVLEGSLGENPPPGSTPVVWSGARWTAFTVPVPSASGSGSGSPLTVVAWEVALHGSGSGSGPLTIDRKSQRVCGLFGGGYDCCEYGSGSGNNDGGPALRSGGRSTAVSFAPTKWRVPAAGLPDPFGDAPGGAWRLSLRDAGVWDNGGDGLAGPRVELVCEGPPLALWRLRLRHGARAVEYTAAAGWFAVGPLTLAASDPGDFPATLTMIPA